MLSPSPDSILATKAQEVVHGNLDQFAQFVQVLHLMFDDLPFTLIMHRYVLCAGGRNSRRLLSLVSQLKWIHRPRFRCQPVFVEAASASHTGVAAWNELEEINSRVWLLQCKDIRMVKWTVLSFAL